MKFEMNEAEKRTLEEIKKGKTEFWFNKSNLSESKEKIEAIFYLQFYGFVNAELYSDEEKVGQINVSITERGYYNSMNEDEMKKDISEKINKFIEGN